METRWVERHIAFEDLYVFYLYIILCLEIISKNEDQNWDPKSVVESSGLLRQLMEPKFFIAFHICRCLLEFTKSISTLLQGSDMEICCAYEMITNVQAAFEDIRNNSGNEFHNLYSKAYSMAERAGKAPLTKTRTIGRQILRNNVVSNTPGVYWRRVLFLLLIDCLKNSLMIDFKVKFSSLSNQSKSYLTT